MQSVIISILLECAFRLEQYGNFSVIYPGVIILCIIHQHTVIDGYE